MLPAVWKGHAVADGTAASTDRDRFARGWLSGPSKRIVILNQSRPISVPYVPQQECTLGPFDKMN